MKRRVVFCLFVTSLIAIWLVLRNPTAAAQTEPLPKQVEFSHDIRPILSDNCFACHGPDEKQRQVDLRFDTREGIFADRGGYQVIVPGDSSQSRLFQRISAEDEAFLMPPPWAETTLTQEQIELIRLWIDQGAKWQTHWAFIPPKRPTPPKVKEVSWPRNAIDNFILARLEREGLKPSPKADKATLLRRVTLDLTGLPPTAAEVDAFLADDSPNAYEKRVDRLLKSPHYGERMAMQWLDLARYADTHGYHIDSLREMWHWRDWVIDAFNQNMPFDQFTIEQLAGDLLPNPTLQQKIATGFNRNHMINYEGGAIPEEYRNEYVVDRIDTTATVWMGLTMKCARCHDHKYDPIQQKEFYKFYAFYNTIPEKGLDGKMGNAQPVLQLPSAQQQHQLDKLKRNIAAIEGAMPEKELATLQDEWRKTALSTMPLAPKKGLAAHYEFEGHLADTSGHYRHGRTLRGEVTYDEGQVGTGAVFDPEVHVALGIPTFDRTDPFSIAFWMISSGTREKAVMQKVDDPESRRGFELIMDEPKIIAPLQDGSHVFFRLVHRWPDDAIEVKTKERLHSKSGNHITVTYDGSGKAWGLKLYVDGEQPDVEVTHDNLSGSIRTSGPLQIGNKEIARPFWGRLDDLRIYDRKLTAAEIEQLAVHEPIRAILSSPNEECVEIIRRYEEKRRSKDFDNLNAQYDQRKEAREERACLARQGRLRKYYLTHAAPENFRKLHANLKNLQSQKKKLEDIIPTTMVMREMDKPRETFVLERGDYRNKGEKVTPGVPAVLSPMPQGVPANRLGLAQWLVDPSHPLTARVAANRFWQVYFGSGLVRTSEDFGSQGEPPSHPELLDWLATELIRIGWDIKVMQRLIVTSATYRQSSRTTPALLEKDPQNRLLARGPRFRLPAEMIQDNTLAISGLLNTEVGGPSVYPYQPKHLWKEMALGRFFSGQEYTPGSGKDLYRRSLYTVWKRTVPPPSFVTFDAPDREKCRARRARTNTPLQALVLMNSPTYVEAARAMAERMITEAGRDPGQRIRYGFRAATARNPAPAELEVLLDIAQQQLDDYGADKEAARKLLAVGESEYNRKLDVSELAAWTTVASTILNFDETITKE